MATLTIRNVPMRVVRALKRLVERSDMSMEQKVRDLLEEHVRAAERVAVLKQIEASWSRQSRHPSAEEIDSWISVGRRSLGGQSTSEPAGQSIRRPSRR